MALSSRDIKLHLFKILHLSIEKSYAFVKKHPKVSGVMLVFFIMYIFLSCIYNLLVFLSPFFAFTAILVAIFWSSEQTLIKCVEKKEKEKRAEVKNIPNVYTKDRRGMLYKYPSQNATSRRRNFTGKKLDVYGDLEQKAKNLSAVFRNEFTKKNTEFRPGVRFFEKEIDPYFDSKFTSKKVDVPLKQTLLGEPSMGDLVTCNASYYDCHDTNTEKLEDEKKAIEDSSSGNNKGVEFKEDDQKKLMDLGICEMERNKRLESLIARRRARKQLNLEIENGLIDIESISPSQMSPLLVARMNPFDSPRYFDGIEMPGSAPSALRSPFDIPYEPFEEKPNLKGDILGQEFTSDMPLGPRQDLQDREHRLPSSRVRRLSGMENHDRPEKVNTEEGSESKSEFQAPNPSNEGECEIDIFGLKSEEVDNSDPTNSMSNIASDANIEGVIASAPTARDEFVDFPLSSTHVTNLNDSLYESLATPAFKSNENMLLTNGLIRHAPSCSLASDLQVEFSEIGSPTLTVDENHEDMWGANESSDHDILEGNNWRDIGSSSFSLRNIDEENVGELSFRSPRSDIRDDTPTYAMRSDRNVFANARRIGVSQYSSDVLARWKRLMRLMDTRVIQSPHEMLSDEQEERTETDNLINKKQICNDVNDSEAVEHDNTNDSRNNEEPGASVARQVPDEISTITSSSSSSSSPTSVVPIPHTTVENQEIQIDVQQSDMEDVAQETENGEGSIDSMSQNIQLSTENPNVELHNGDLNNPQVSSNMNDAKVCNKRTGEDFEGKHDDLNQNEAKNHSSEEENYLQIESNEAENHSLKEENHLQSESNEAENHSLKEENHLQSESNEAENHISKEENYLQIESNESGNRSSKEENYLQSETNEAKNHSLKEENYLQSESNQVVKDDIEKEQLDKGDISEDSSLPIVADETINDEDTLRESSNMNNNETMVLSEPAGETDKVSNIAHMNDPEESAST